jgi:hypothetical protein
MFARASKASRREVILGISGQTILIGGVNIAQAAEVHQTSAPPATEVERASAERVFPKLYQIHDLPSEFFRVFDTRVELSAAIVDAEARKLIEQFVNDGVNRASQTLKEASYKFEIGTIAVNSIRLQNVIFANSTDGSGRVNIQTTAIKRAQSSLCPLWPFC